MSYELTALQTPGVSYKVFACLHEVGSNSLHHGFRDKVN